MTSDPPSWAGSVSAEALASLLALHGERDWLDYKRQCDLSSLRDLVEFAKDVGAMMIAGGYILVGADDHGQPASQPARVDLFDPAILHKKLARYIPGPFEIRAATHVHQGQSYTLVYVVPHQDGFCIFKQDGAHPDGRGQTIVFRAGEVFARHGTSSERWNQADIALIKRRVRADADRGRDQHVEALQLLQDVPRQLGGSGLWLAMAVVPECPVADPPIISPQAAQQFLQDWEFAQAPIDGFNLGSATYRQRGGVVITSQAAISEPPYWWRLALHEAGPAVGAYVLAHEVAASPLTEDKRWYGLPSAVCDGQTIPTRRDEVEIRIVTLLDVLTAHAARVGVGGRVLVMVMLLAPRSDAWSRIALLNQLVDDSEQRQGWRLASARALQPLREAVMVPVEHRVRLADMRDPTARMSAAYRLAAELLAIFGVDKPELLTADGTLDPDGAATDHDQIVYQHARHVGLPVPPISPIERRQRFEERIRAAKAELRQH
jgi:hypothetical protein